MVRTIQKLFQWIRGDHLPTPNQDSGTGFSELIWALGFVLTQIVGLTASQVGETRMEWFSVSNGIYFGVSAVVIITVVLIMRATRVDEAGKVQRTFDQGSILFSKWVLAIALVAGISMPFLAVAGKLPGQKRYVVFNPSTVEKGSFENEPSKELWFDRDECLKIAFEIKSEHFPNNVPEKFYVDLVWKKEAFHKSFVFVAAHLYLNQEIRTSPLVKPEPNTVQEEELKRTSRKRALEFRHMWPLSQEEKYSVILYFAKRKNNQIDLEHAVERAKDALSISIREQ